MAQQRQLNGPQRILVVDDEASILRLVTAVLGSSGYDVDGAEDGAVAWQALRAERYDLLITDNSMPNVSGVELIKKVRAARIVLPIIMASGNLPTHELSLEIAATLLKPFAIKALLNAVKEVLCNAVPTIGSS